MDTPKMLSGEDLVKRGVTKTFATLPEIGLKDVTPNGSWLEQKQIQAALEARKQLIEVERIEKVGSLSQAEWRDDLKLAEVTKQTGSYWQFFGHNVGKKLYLRCEEALFLMEVNCLQLKHNEVTVSLQKAYSLLLSDKFTINQYKVYASLSRLGYKVFRHREIDVAIEKEKQSEETERTSDRVMSVISPDNADEVINTAENMDKTKTIILDAAGNVHKTVEKKNMEEEENSSIQSENDDLKKTKNSHPEINNKNDRERNTEDQDCVMNSSSTSDNNNSEDLPKSDAGHSSQDTVTDAQDNSNTDSTKSTNVNKKVLKYEKKIQKIQSRKMSTVKDIQRFFDEIPDMSRTDVVYVNMPEDCYIPRNIYVNKTTYKLNLDIIKGKKCRSSSIDSLCSNSDEENRNLRRIHNNPITATSPHNSVTHYYPHLRLPRINQQFRPFLFWRPHTNFNFLNFNTYHQRFQSQFPPRLHFLNRPNMFLRPHLNPDMFESNEDFDNPCHGAMKRPKNTKYYHLRTVKNLAIKVRNHILSGYTILPGHAHIHAVQVLHKLLNTYNNRYHANLRLTPEFELVDESIVVETIELDDEETRSKRPRLEEDTFKENLGKLRLMATKLKDLEVKGVSTSRNRRAFSAAIKSFNKSYNADVFLNDKFEMVDRRHITLDSSSDSENVASHNNRRFKKKKLRNPFYILKKLSEKQSNGNASTSRDTIEPKVEPTAKRVKRSSLINSSWLPIGNDFGRAEICQDEANLCMMYREDEYVYDFLKNHAKNYKDWLEIKVAFAKYLKQITKQCETDHNDILALAIENQTKLRSLVGPEDCSDMPTLLEKLRIIKSYKSENVQSDVKVNFDVYNRDVPNFRKSNPPKPHFRIVCCDDSSNFPSGDDISYLNAKYDDKIPTVFAIVGVGSVSYLQINSIDLPVYTPTTLQ